MPHQNVTAGAEFQRPSGCLVSRRPKAGALLPLALISLALLALQPSAAQAQAPLTDDASVSSRSGNANHSNNPNLRVSSSENVFLKFKLTSLPVNTPGSEVEKATLKIYISKIRSAGKLDIYAVAGEWDERTITPDNAPPLGGLVTTTGEIEPDQEDRFLAIDITSLVQQWLGDDGQGANGLPNNGVAIFARPLNAANDGAADLTFDSKENSQTSHEAQLNIQLRRASGLQQVATDASLRGDGTSAAPLGVAAGGIDSVHLADNAVTGAKIADGAVTSSELADAAVASSKIADGAVTSAKIAPPLSLTSADPAFTLSVVNTGAGAAVRAGGTIDTTTQYNIGGQRVLSVPGLLNTFAGVGAGLSNTTGLSNSFFGFNAGQNNNTGSSNSFFGHFAGALNTFGFENSFFGSGAGVSNTFGVENSFFGQGAGSDNTTGSQNSFFGVEAGRENTTGRFNSFFGGFAGFGNTTGNNNSFFGAQAGSANTTGFNNSFFGRSAGLNNTTGNFNSFFGHSAGLGNTTGSQNAFFGFSAGGANTTGISNSFFGSQAGNSNTTGGGNSFFGNAAGFTNTTGEFNAFFGLSAGFTNTTGSSNTFFGQNAGNTNTTENENTFIGAQANGVAGITNATAIGAFAQVTQSNSLALGRSNVSVGIGTSAPKAKLHVAGKVYVEANGQGVILKSPGGVCFELTVTDAGALTIVPVTCP